MPPVLKKKCKQPKKLDKLRLISVDADELLKMHQELDRVCSDLKSVISRLGPIASKLTQWETYDDIPF